MTAGFSDEYRLAERVRPILVAQGRKDVADLVTQDCAPIKACIQMPSMSDVDVAIYCMQHFDTGDEDADTEINLERICDGFRQMCLNCATWLEKVPLDLPDEELTVFIKAMDAAKPGLAIVMHILATATKDA